MFTPANWSYRGLLVAGFGIYAITAFATQGYYHPDEHFQILEFADYQLGVTPSGDLPWEFREQIRPALQPALAAGLIRSSQAVGVFNPFTQAFLLRLVSGLLAILVYARMSRRLAGEFASDSSAKLLLALTIVLWFVPYLSVRFSSENWSALALLSGVGLLPISDTDNSGSARQFAGAGLLLGLSFVLRFQMTFAVVGVVAWLLFHRRVRPTTAAALVAGGLGAVAIGVLVDHWFYGHFVFTSWQYFRSNVLAGKAAEFGVSPWWFYFPAFIKAGFPPISLLLLGLAALGMYRRRQHVLTWTFIAFVLAHSLVGHKELRFLFPMLFPFLWLVVSGWEEWRARLRVGHLTRLTLRVCIAVNAVALVFVSTRAAQQVVPCWRFLYDYSRNKPVVLYAERASPYWIGILRPHFYRAPGLAVRVVPTVSELTDSTRAQMQSGDLLLQRHLAPPPVVPGYRVEQVYRAFPEWLLRLDITHWVERTEIWSIYRVSRTG